MRVESEDFISFKRSYINGLLKIFFLPILTRRQIYDAYNCGTSLILTVLMNERVAEVDASDPHDFTIYAYLCLYFPPKFLNNLKV